MPEIEKKVTLDLLDIPKPALSATSDMPVIETKPDATPAAKAEAKPKAKEDAAPEKAVKGKTEEGKAAESAPAEKEAKADTAEATPDDSSASAETDETTIDAEADVRADQKEPSKKSKGVQKRIDELTRQREDERRAREATEARLDRALGALERLTGKPAVEARQEIEEEDPEPVRPVKAQFADDAAFDDARDKYSEEKARWIAKREIRTEIAERERKAVEARTQEENQRVHTSYKERVDKAQERYEDYFAVAESPDVAISVPMAQAIMASEYGPDIQYYLGNNRNEAERISKLSVPQQLLALGRIEAKVAVDLAKAETPADAPAKEEKPAIPAKKSVSSAPAPISKLKGGSSETHKPIEDMSMDEYADYRKRQLAAERRPGVR